MTVMSILEQRLAVAVVAVAWFFDQVSKKIKSIKNFL